MADGAKVWIEDKKLMAMLKRMTEEVPGGRKGHRNRHIKKFGKDAREHIDDRFGWKGVDENDAKGAWPDLKKRTEFTKFHKGARVNAPLIWTGRLRASVKIKVSKRGRYLVQDIAGPAAEYYWFHHYGKTYDRVSKRGRPYKVVLPQRRLLLWTHANREQCKARLLEWWNKVQKQTTV